MSPAALSALVAILVPLIVAVVANCKWPSQWKSVAALVVSLLVGVATAWANGSLDPQQIATSVLVVIGAAQASYVIAWKPLGITSWILDNVGNT